MPIRIIGFGIRWVSSPMRTPSPPQKMTTFMNAPSRKHARMRDEHTRENRQKRSKVEPIRRSGLSGEPVARASTAEPLGEPRLAAKLLELLGAEAVSEPSSGRSTSS